MVKNMHSDSVNTSGQHCCNYSNLDPWVFFSWVSVVRRNALRLISFLFWPRFGATNRASSSAAARTPAGWRWSTLLSHNDSPSSENARRRLSRNRRPAKAKAKSGQWKTNNGKTFFHLVFFLFVCFLQNGFYSVFIMYKLCQIIIKSDNCSCFARVSVKPNPAIYMYVYIAFKYLEFKTLNVGTGIA